MAQPSRLRRAWRHGGLALGLFACVAMVWGWTPDDVTVPGCSLGRHAAWISVDWTSKPVDQNAVWRLARGAEERGIGYLFPYTGYLKEDGNFSKSAEHAADFVQAYHRAEGRARLLAWVGVPLQSDRVLGVHGWVDLSQQETRQLIVAHVADLIARGGFDGVQLNVETVPNHDPHFLSLLEELRQSIGSDRLLSIAGSQWVPDAVNLLPPVRNLRWTRSYYRQVAQRVDQIAAMTYDSHTFDSTLYRLWMREQVKGLSESLAGLDTELLIGISVSREETSGHRVRVEDLRSGLAGLCAGLRAGATAQGVAIYADWDFKDTDHDVWRQWRD